MTKDEIRIIERKFEYGDLTYHDGDGVEYEIWLDEDTGKKYNVPIQINRYFEEMEEVKENE
tara:strand:- start:441 stop:623 length:183 start_codon:yes stop_codon:yes gene_type:complete